MNRKHEYLALSDFSQFSQIRKAASIARFNAIAVAGMIRLGSVVTAALALKVLVIIQLVTLGRCFNTAFLQKRSEELK